MPLTRIVHLAISVLVATVAIGSPTLVVAQSPATHVVKVVGDRHQLALASDGAIVGWGPWRNGELGPVSAIGVTTPWTNRAIALELAGKAVDLAAVSTAGRCPVLRPRH